jgi:hypothetical protein
MKTLVAALLLTGATMSNGFCKPGGWFFDLLDRSSISINSGYSCGTPRQVYYQSAPVYYVQPAPVHYTPRVYYAPPQPVYYEQRCGSGSSFYFQGNRFNNHRH